MSNKITISYAAIGQLMKSEEMRSLVETKAANMAASAGDGYSYRLHNTGQRIAANVFPETKDAVHDNYENNTLLIAMGRIS